jgi:hypothetical protein
MIKIDGLTPRQAQLMDLLWQCRDQEAVKSLIAALPTHRDQVDASSLIKIAIWETHEQELGLGEYKDAAANAIARAMQ